MQPVPFSVRKILVAPLLVWAVQAAALGLGEIHTGAVLGEPLRAQIELQLNPGEVLDSGCFRLYLGDDDALPWLRQAALTLRKGPPAILDIRSAAPLRDPILRLGVAVACGHDLKRDYTLLLSLQRNGGAMAPPAGGRSELVPSSQSPVPLAKAPRRSHPERELPPPERLAPRQPQRRAPAAAMPDRLLLSGGGEGGDAPLQLAAELASLNNGAVPASEEQREILRLEFRTLLVLNQQALSQLATAEKLRNLEATLTELQQRAGDFAQRVENRQGAATPEPPPQPAAGSGPAPAPQASLPPLPTAGPVSREEAVDVAEWSFYGIVLGVLLGIAGWLGWRHFQGRREESEGVVLSAPEIVVDPQRESETDEPGGVDLHVEPAVMGMPMQIDVELDADTSEAPLPPVPQGSLDSSFSLAAATVHEHFEVNPVMELAEIMLSFGRVKGAAQALQEFIDQNPNEALMPWIRLLDVYRMAGMREEFDRVAKNLNQHFNVEVVKWDPSQVVQPPPGLDFELEPREDLAEPASKAITLEEIPHIRQNLIDSWSLPDCADYLNRLLRDNRGGKRSGFALQVVDEILFLIELRGTIDQIDAEKNQQGEKP